MSVDKKMFCVQKLIAALTMKATINQWLLIGEMRSEMLLTLVIKKAAYKIESGFKISSF